MNERKKVFISCVEEDRPFIEGLHRDLENYGFETFWYAEDSPAGVSFKNHTTKEINSCDHFLACFSEASTNKEQSDMRRELTLACDIHKTLPLHTNWLICLKINDCEIEDYRVGNQIPLKELTYISFAENYNDGLEKLISEIIEQDSIEEYTGIRFKNKISSAKTMPAHNFSLDHANSIITEISGESAEAFQKLASLAIFIHDRGKLTIENSEDIRICDFVSTGTIWRSGPRFFELTKYGISARELMILEEERLINLSLVDPILQVTGAYYQKRLIMDKEDPSRYFKFSGIPLTNRGRTLCVLLSRTSQLSFNRSYYNDILEFYLNEQLVEQ